MTVRATALALLLAAPAVAQDMPDAVGRITYGKHQPGAAICTGTLVAPDLVLTAGHCVNKAVKYPGSVHFSAGYRNGRSVAVARGVEVILAAGEGLEADVALLRIAPALSIPPIPLAAEITPRLTRFGYRRDAAEEAEWRDDCLLLDADPPVLGFGCTAVSGQSGSGMLASQVEGWRLVAVTVGTQGPFSYAIVPPPDLIQRIPQK